VDNDLAEAVARAEAIEEEPFEGSPEAQADVSQRMEAVQREIVIKAGPRRGHLSPWSCRCEALP
jgi:hypothetical protein